MGARRATSGGMRATHTAGYTILDPTSPIFIRGDTVYIPTVFVSFYGDALDEKTPLLRAMKAVDVETTRLLKNLGYSVGGVQPNIGLEQEYFLVPRSAFYKRMDLQLTGRTIMGKFAPRGQEMCDHYMGPPNQIAMACIQEIQHECFMMGIPMRTRHREVAPNQYECAPFFGLATTQIDQNLMFMQIAEEVAARHGLACLLAREALPGHQRLGQAQQLLDRHERRRQPLQRQAGSPFPNQECRAEPRPLPDHHGRRRPAVDTPRRPDAHGDRVAGQRLPPRRVRGAAGDRLDLPRRLAHRVPRGVQGGQASPAIHRRTTKTVDLGIAASRPSQVPAEDRNRTSPFPYGGHRFEFRAVGSSQNVSMVNTVLCSIDRRRVQGLLRRRSRPGQAAKTWRPSAQRALEGHLQRQRLLGGVADRGGQARRLAHRLTRVESTPKIRRAKLRNPKKREPRALFDPRKNGTPP